MNISQKLRYFSDAPYMPIVVRETMLEASILLSKAPTTQPQPDEREMNENKTTLTTEKIIENLKLYAQYGGHSSDQSGICSKAARLLESQAKRIAELEAGQVGPTDLEKDIQSFMKAFGVDRSRAEELFREANSPSLLSSQPSPGAEVRIPEGWERCPDDEATSVYVNGKISDNLERSNYGKNRSIDLLFGNWWTGRIFVMAFENLGIIPIRRIPAPESKPEPSEAIVEEHVADTMPDIFSSAYGVILTTKFIGQTVYVSDRKPLTFEEEEK